MSSPDSDAKLGPRQTTVRVLSIAGSDSCGGAGIQADLKAFARCGVHGMTAVTAITAQSTADVVAVHLVPAAVVAAQIASVLGDIGVDAVKIGMLGDAETVAAVVQALAELDEEVAIVVDPVLEASSGSSLLTDAGVVALIELLLPRATVITPNVREARALVAAAPAGSPQDDDFSSLLTSLHELGPRHVVLTGGDGESGAADAKVVDRFFDGERVVEIATDRQRGGAGHGSGCTHSAALAAMLARGAEPLEAARAAQAVAAQAIAHGLADLGTGPGPVDALSSLRDDGG